MTQNDVVAFIPQTPVFFKEIYQEGSVYLPKGNGTLIEIQVNYSIGVLVKLILRDTAKITILQRIKELKTWQYELDFKSLCSKWHVLFDYCRIISIANTSFNPEVFERIKNAK
ncbi:MAG: hypothetical protein WC254_07715 [Candidatus Woesearchaeota archaeon]